MRSNAYVSREPYRKWYTYLSRNKYKGKSPCLSDFVQLSGNKYIVISKVKYIQYTDTSGKLIDKDIRNYTAFDGYPDLLEFLRETSSDKREFHETILQNAKQKPRFDIDIKHKEYLEFISQHSMVIDFATFGEMIKDIVIESCIRVAKSVNIDLSLQKDFMIFESHRAMKRSYHIILNRYHHINSQQAREFYLLVGSACHALDKMAYDRFVDGGIYKPNANLRILWCIKIEENTPISKKYSPSFNFEGVEYNHMIDTVSYDLDDAERILTSGQIELKHLENSLVTSTHNSSQFPLLPIRKTQERENTEITDETMLECIEKINDWDSDKVFAIEHDEDGKVINLLRNHPSFCEICKREHELHPAFCYVEDGYLYWHCGRAEGRSGIIVAKLTTVTSSSSKVLQDLYERGIIDNLSKEIKAPTLQSEDSFLTITVGDQVVKTIKHREQVKTPKSIKQDKISLEIVRRERSYLQDFIMEERKEKALASERIEKEIDEKRVIESGEENDKEEIKITRKKISKANNGPPQAKISKILRLRGF